MRAVPGLEAVIKKGVEDVKTLPTYRMVPVEQFEIDPIHAVCDVTHCMYMMYIKQLNRQHSVGCKNLQPLQPPAQHQTYS